MKEAMKEKLMEKIRRDGGDMDYVDTLEEIINKEGNAAEESKKNYFGVEIAIIGFSMLSGIAAAMSTADTSVWDQKTARVLLPWFEIASIVFPLVISALVAYRGLKKSYETWLRHRKYNLELELLANEYLYGSESFDGLNGRQAYLRFRNKTQEMFRKSTQEFFSNMNR